MRGVASHWIAASALALAACGDDGSSNATESTSTSGGSTDADATSTSATTGVDGSGSDDGDATTTGDTGDPHELGVLCEDGLPVDYERPDEGEPLTPTELTAATEQYLELLGHLDYLDFTRQRVHGWPQSDPSGYWFGTWWSGVTIVREGGDVTFRHEQSGADNNGLRTGPVLEGICYAMALWDRPEDQANVRAMIRGLIAWILAMERQPDDPDAPMLSRAFYPESVTGEHAGVSYLVEYGLNRPGIDAEPSEYVHVPQNPHWGDIWIKNKRSKDDIGHMLRAIAQLDACKGGFDDETMADFEQLRTMYAAWARRVEDDDWRIATLDKAGELWFPTDLLANFVLMGNAECDAVLSLRLLGRGDPGTFDCGNGIGELDPFIIGATDHNGNILRSFHEAAANNAFLTGHDDVGALLLEGLAARIVEGLDGLQGVGEPVDYLEPQDEVDMMIHGASVGVPLTSREVRWLHERIAEAHQTYTGANNDAVLQALDPAAPDGEYPFQPGGAGIHYRSLAGILGTCASPCLNPTTRPVLDCTLLRGQVPTR